MSKKIQCLLAGIGLAKYAAVFRDNDIDDDVLANLDDADLKERGVSLGHRKKILKAIAHAPHAQPPTPKAALVKAAERRQLTAMFCDLADSTALSTVLDVEE
jgi:class 3 adenylate cyclase